MPDPTERLNAALEGRYSIERELGEGGMATGGLKSQRRGVIRLNRFFTDEMGAILSSHGDE